jgi:hypothetical protein
MSIHKERGIGMKLKMKKNAFLTDQCSTVRVLLFHCALRNVINSTLSKAAFAAKIMKNKVWDRDVE